MKKSYPRSIVGISLAMALICAMLAGCNSQKKDEKLADWAGTWNAMTSYFDDPELQDAFSQGAETCSMSVEQLKTTYGALIVANYTSLVIDGNTIKFCSEADGSGTAETITYEYVDEYTLTTGDEKMVWYEFEGNTDGEYKYLAITLPERDASDQVKAIHYRNSSKSFDALFAEDVTGAATFISSDSTTEEINNTLSSVFKELAAYFAAAKQ